MPPARPVPASCLGTAWTLRPSLAALPLTVSAFAIACTQARGRGRSELRSALKAAGPALRLARDRRSRVQATRGRRRVGRFVVTQGHAVPGSGASPAVGVSCDCGALGSSISAVNTAANAVTPAKT